MSNLTLIKTLSSLSGQRIENYTDYRTIERSGFYANGINIEHWSKPCDYTRALSHAPMNDHGLLLDGFISLVGNDDIEQIAEQVHNWAKHLDKYGVEV